MSIEKKLFNIFQENKDRYDLYTKTLEFINKTIIDIKGEENANTYEILRLLSGSINNAGWQERRSEQIDFINENMYKISDKYEKYLP